MITFKPTHIIIYKHLIYTNEVLLLCTRSFNVSFIICLNFLYLTGLVIHPISCYYANIHINKRYFYFIVS